jgi:MFS family permease
MTRVRLLFGALGFLLAGYYATWQVDLLGRGYDLAQIASLVALGNLLSLMLDVPSSLLGDRIGHKKTVAAGMAVYGISFVFPASSTSAFALAAAVIGIAVGDALIEGALESWVADVQRVEKGAVTNRQYMTLDQYQRGGMILGAIAIPGAISLLGQPARGSWLIYVGVAIAVFILTLTIPKGNDTRTHHLGASRFHSLGDALKRPALRWVLLAVFLYGLSDGTVQIGFWPRLKELGISDAAILGAVQASMSLARLFGLQIWKKSHLAESPKAPSIALILSGLVFVIFSHASNVWLAILLWLLRIAILSAYFSTLKAWLQREFADSPWRATLASSIGIAAQLGVLLITGVFGASILPIDLSAIGTIGGTLTISSGLLLLVSRRRHLDSVYGGPGGGGG